MDIRFRLNRRALAAAFALASAACTGSAARTQQDEVVEDDALAPPQVNRNFEISIEQFDMWIYGNNFRMNGMPGAQKQNPRTLLDARLALKVDEIEKICKVSPSQKEKLRLAGRGDMKRFLEQVEKKRREFEEIRRDQNKFGQFYQEIQPLRTTFQSGLFGDGSFFSKALRKTLDGAEAARFEANIRERAAFRYAASVDMLTARLGQALGLTEDQRKRVSQVIVENTRPPKSLGSQEVEVVFHQASKVPAAKFKDILDDAQLRMLERQFLQMRMHERNLKANGYVPDDDPDPQPRAAAARKD